MCIVERYEHRRKKREYRTPKQCDMMEDDDAPTFSLLSGNNNNNDESEQTTRERGRRRSKDVPTLMKLVEQDGE
jgi:hypothetical protein